MLGLIPLPYRILAVVALFATTAVLSFWQGYRMADRSAQIEAQARVVASLTAERDEWLRQAKAAQDVARQAAERERAAVSAKASMEAEIEDYAQALASRPDCGCGFSDDDVRRLQRLNSTRRRAPGPSGPDGVLRPGSKPDPPGR